MRPTRSVPVLRLWRVAFALLIPIVALSTTVAFVARAQGGLPTSPLLAVSLLIDWTLWALLVPLIVGFTWRVPLDAGPRFRGFWTHLAFGGALTAIELTVFSLIEWLVVVPFSANQPESLLQTLWANVSLWYPYALLVYTVIAVAAHAAEAARRSRQRELEAAQLKEELTRAQLVALRMQLHPHFLCNALNTASVFVQDGRSEDAIEVIVGLGDLLNHTLDSMDRPDVSLGEELDFIDRYLAIERRRFPDRLVTRIDVEEGLMAVAVPTMILQPIVENSIKHGFSRSPDAGLLEIVARRRDDVLEVVVRDDGPGFGPRRTREMARDRGEGGVGLENIRRRLERLYGDRGILRCEDAGDRGAQVTIAFPINTEIESAA